MTSPKNANVSVTYGNNVAYGTIDVPDGYETRVVLWMPGSGVYAGSPTVSYAGTQVRPATWNSTSRTVRIDVTSDGDFRVEFSSPSSSAKVNSSCPL